MCHDFIYAKPMRTHSTLTRAPGSRRKALAALALMLAVSPVVAGCQGSQGGRPVPASFSPSPCPPGWHRDDGDCLITGTLAPGQNLPLPTISGTPVQWPGKTPAGSLGQP